MNMWLTVILMCVATGAPLAWCSQGVCGEAAPPAPARGPLDPRGKIHIPIGIPDTLDGLKTFVEAEGNFSPGFATYGIYFWLYDHETKKLTAPTMDGVACEHGLAPGGLLIPWSEWKAGDVTVRTEVCQVRRASPAGEVVVVAARAHLANTGSKETKCRLRVLVRPLGPAGGEVSEISAGTLDSPHPDALFVDGHPAVVANTRPQAAGGGGDTSLRPPEAPAAGEAQPPSLLASLGLMAGMAFDLSLAPGQKETLGFICPVLPGRRAVGHQWDGKSPWAQLDLAKPNPAEGGVLQPDPGLDYYRSLKADAIFEEAAAYWKGFVGKFTVRVPDPRWPEALAAMLSHAAISMNDGAPDVAVVNYNVFNRDGVYVANILQKAGQFDLAARAIDYFLAHPFNGRVYPEADNPGQILWAVGEHWMFTRDKDWLKRVYPSARQLAEMIKYYRTTPGPHWVSMNSLKFGDALAPGERQELKPGRCDGSHPEYTEAFDVAGLWRAALLAQAMDEEKDTADWSALADSLLAAYEARFGANLAKGYGSYAVLWPCRLYPFGEGKGRETFKKVGAQPLGQWRYFPLATAHQGLLAGNRDAATGTIAAHLDHEQMRGWYAFDEGGKSGSGGWGHARTTWTPSVAMPHGWAIAEMWLLLRDALLFEDGDRLVLLGGVPAEWFTGKQKMAVENLPTYFGACSFEYVRIEGGAVLTLSGPAAPADGYILRLPGALKATVKIGNKPAKGMRGGDFWLPPGTKRAEIAFSQAP